MANLNTGGFFQNHLSWLEQSKVDDPWWLLLTVIPVVLFLNEIRKRPEPVDRYWGSATVHDLSVKKHRAWPKHTISTILLASMVALAYPAASPITEVTRVQENALLIWVYDASESMETKDVIKDDVLISRLDASVFALEESLETIPPHFYKLLVSFAGSDEVHVGLPTLNSQELLMQARNIPQGEKTATDFGLEQAIQTCRQFFNDKDNYPCEIFLLSDGECNPRPDCRLKSEAIALEAQTKGIIIHAVSWGNPDSEYRPSPADMQAIADAGQGQHLSSVQTSELAELYSDVAIGLEVQTTQQMLAAGWVWGARTLILLLGLVFWLRRLV